MATLFKAIVTANGLADFAIAFTPACAEMRNPKAKAPAVAGAREWMEF
jgi:hypothetical protein